MIGTVCRWIFFLNFLAGNLAIPKTKIKKKNTMFQQLYFGKIHTKLTTKGLGENYYNGMYLTGKNLAQAYMSNDKKWLNYGTSQIKVFPHIPGA